VYFITRVCERHECRLTPHDDMMAAFAVAWRDAEVRHGMRTAALCVEPTHYHAVVIDSAGRLSDFLRDVHATVARFGNAVEDARVKFWSLEGTHVVEVMDAQAAVDCVAYVLANPVKDRLVRALAEWPGILTKVDDIGRDRGARYERPAAFFAVNGPVSSEVELVAVVPAMAVTAFGVDGYRERVRRAVWRVVEGSHAEARADGRGFMGATRVKAQSVWCRVRGPEARRAGTRAEPKRRVAAAAKATVEATLARMKAFREAYRAVRARWVAGEHGAEFPRGTWWLWRFCGVARVGSEPYAPSA